jgi:hypothetical protein
MWCSREVQHSTGGIALKTHRRGRVALFAASVVVAVAGVAPATAGAVAVTVTGDSGAPIALGGPVNIRNMNPTVAVDPQGQFYGFTVTGPNGAQVAVQDSCVGGSPGGETRLVDYVGNGAYTVNLARYSTSSCTGAPVATSAVSFAITASVALGQPTTPVLTRKAGSVIPNTIQLPIDLNPGALTHEVFAERNVQLNSDGSLPGAPTQLFPDSATKTVDVRLDKGPGTYLVVARAKGFAGLNPTAFTAWSPPATIRAFAPFDTQKFTWTDTRGPSYRFSAVIRATGATGTVTVGIRRGTKGKFRSSGKVKIRKHRFSKRIRLPRTGKYQLRLGYKGNSTVAPGSEVRSFRITRRISFARAALTG